MEFENDELGLPITLSGKFGVSDYFLISLFPRLYLSFLIEFFENFTFQICSEGKIAVGDESWSPVQKSEGTPMVEVTMNKGIISAAGEKAEAIDNKGKQPSASPVITPTQNKPAKRRITPMAID